jgi:protein required for attachment to host cells
MQHSSATWIVLADAGRARILQARQPGRDLEEVEELTDAAAHAHDADFRHDATGRRAPADSHGGAPSQQTMPGNATTSASEDKLELEADRFARRVAERLAQAHRQHRYERLCIAAAPKFLGRLRKVLPHEVSEVVVEEIDKDLLQLDKRELAQRFNPAGGTRH